MELMTARRRLLQTGKAAEDYIQDGLIFFLDGLDRGGITGQWRDKVGGKVFELVGVTEYPSYVQFGSGAYGVYDGYISTDVNGETGEFVITGLSTSGTGQGIFIQPLVDGAVGYSVYHRQGNWWFEINNDQHVPYRVTATDTPKTISTQGWTNPLGYENGVRINRNGQQNYWGGNQTGKTYLGARVTTGSPYQWYYGGIYAVRIYSRKLTADEVLHNQRLDNIRYGLGLDIPGGGYLRLEICIIVPAARFAESEVAA